VEICTGKALIDGNLKLKTYDQDNVYVVNHESGTIYNDVVKFDKGKQDEAIKQFGTYPQNDATVLVRGSDGQILKKKGEDNYIA